MALNRKMANSLLALFSLAVTVLSGALFVLGRKGASLEPVGPGAVPKLAVVVGIIGLSLAEKHVAARSGRKEANL